MEPDADEGGPRRVPDAWRVMRPRTQPERSILDALPPELSIEASPERCICSGCAPEVSTQARAEHERTVRAWSAARKAWCLANGYRLIELMLAEEAASAKKTAAQKTPSWRPTKNRKETK